jgi:hypothetical protein
MLQQKTDLFTTHRLASSLTPMSVIDKQYRKMKDWEERIPNSQAARNSIAAMVCDTAREVFLDVNESEDMVDDYRKILAKQGDIELLAWLEDERTALKERLA